MQFKEKLMNQTRKWQKTLLFVPFWPKLTPVTQFFFVGLTSTTSQRLSSAIIIFNFKETQKMGKIHFGPDLGLLGPNSGRTKFFYVASSYILFRAFILRYLNENY